MPSCEVRKTVGLNGGDGLVPPSRQADSVDLRRDVTLLPSLFTFFSYPRCIYDIAVIGNERFMLVSSA